MKNKKVISVILVGVALAVIVVLGVTAGRLVAGRQQELEQVQEESQTPPAQTATRNEVTYEGQTYRYNENLTNTSFFWVWIRNRKSRCKIRREWQDRRTASCCCRWIKRRKPDGCCRFPATV